MEPGDERGDGDGVVAAAARRRTFAIISHPDAGKTTLTEKFLLYAGAVQRAGAVKARDGRRAATSDWMELERQRGISVTSTVLQFPYRDHVVNLLDTPGHRDFSEDTYRVLSGVDAVVMVLDTAKGIETQTRKLFEVCRARRLPVLTFLNKYDRPGREPLELLDEIEEQIGLRPTPATWPVGVAGDLRGVVDRRRDEYVRYTRTERGASLAPEQVVPAAVAADEEGPAWRTAADELALLDAVGADVDLPSFLAGDSTPVYVGVGADELRGADAARRRDRPGPATVAALPTRPGTTARSTPTSTAFVFKVQANMDPSHRDRLAFARICSGRFDRGMTVTCDRTGRDLTTKYAATAFGPDRETVDVAYPGDVVGLVNATGLQLGDTVYAAGSRAVTYPPIPRFSPEVFATARPLDTARTKQFRAGPRAARRGGRRAGAARRRRCGHDADPGRGRRLAVRGVRPSPGQRVQRAGRDPPGRLPGHPPHRPRLGATPARDRGHPPAAPLGRRAGGAVREPLPAAPASRSTSRSCASNRWSPGPSPSSGHLGRRRPRRASSSHSSVRRRVACGRREVVDDDHPLDHVAQHGRPRPPAQPDRDHGAARVFGAPTGRRPTAVVGSGTSARSSDRWRAARVRVRAAWANNCVVDDMRPV